MIGTVSEIQSKRDKARETKHTSLKKGKKEREREKECVCACVCVHACVRITIAQISSKGCASNPRITLGDT